MRFKITLKDRTVIYVNDLCMFGGESFGLSTWVRTESGLKMTRIISMDRIRTIMDMGMLIYC